MRQKIDVFFWLKNETKRFSLIINDLSYHIEVEKVVIDVFLNSRYTYYR